MPIIKKKCPICQKEFVIRRGKIITSESGYWTNEATIMDTQNYILHLLEEHILEKLERKRSCLVSPAVWNTMDEKIKTELLEEYEVIFKEYIEKM